MSTIRFNRYQIALVALLPSSGGFITAAVLAQHTALTVERVREEMEPLVLDNVVTYDVDRDEYEVGAD